MIAYLADHQDCPLVIGNADGVLQYPISGLHTDSQHIHYDGSLLDYGNQFYSAVKVNLGSIFSLSENVIPNDFILDLAIPSDQSAYQPISVQNQFAYLTEHVDQPLVIGFTGGMVVYPINTVYSDSIHVQQTTTGAPSTTPTAIDSGYAYYGAFAVNFGTLYALSSQIVPYDILINWRSSSTGVVWVGLYKNKETLPFNGNGVGTYCSCATNPVAIGISRVGQINSLRIRIAVISSVQDFEIARIEVRLKKEVLAGA